MPDIKQELTKLGFVQAKKITANHKNRTSVEDAVQGKRVITECGDVIIIEKTYPYGTNFGSCQLAIPENFGNFRKIVQVDSIPDNPEKYLYVDTETTGLNGGTGTLPFLIGYGFFNPDGFTVQQLLMDSPVNETTQLLEFIKAVGGFETTITFNGKSFDLPLIKTRYLMNKIEPPLEYLSHIDLLHVSRNIWKMRLADRSLHELESRILEFSRSDEEIPGWMIPQVYFEFLKSGDPSELKRIVYHNRIDILGMAVLHQKIISMIDNIHAKDENELLDNYAFGIIFQKRLQYFDAICVFEKCIDNPDLNDGLLIDLHMRIAKINKMLKKWDSAISHWIQASELGSIDSCVELAKYYEHVEKSKDEALNWSIKAKNFILHPKNQTFQTKNDTIIINKRITRLNRR